MSAVVKRRMVACEKCHRSMRYDKLARHLTTCVGPGRFCPICECMLLDKTPEDVKIHLLNCGRKWYVNQHLYIYKTFLVFKLLQVLRLSSILQVL